VREVSSYWCRYKEEAVARFNVVPSDGFVLRPIHPWLAITASLRAVISIDRVERSSYHPSRQQLRSSGCGKAAISHPHERVAGQPEISNCGTEMPACGFQVLLLSPVVEAYRWAPA